MLEELLKNEKRDPGEEAYVMLSFVQVELQGGGANAEKRFFSLYGLLCDNIFGSIQGAKEEYKHKQGGWLSSQYPWRRPSSQTRSSSGVQRNLVQSGSTLSSSSASCGSSGSTTATAVRAVREWCKPARLLEGQYAPVEVQLHIIAAVPWLWLPSRPPRLRPLCSPGGVWRHGP